jgi:FlaA1/EpsC-like NDP-sugar epimerase
MLKFILPQKHAPRWMVTVVDLGVSVLALYMAALLRFEFRIPPLEWEVWKSFLPVFLTARLTAFLLFNTSAGIIRHTGLEDVKRIALCTSAVTLVFGSANLMAAKLGNAPYWIPFSILGIEWVLTTATMVSSRWVVKWLYLQNKRQPGVRSQIAIYGAGEAGILAKEAIDRELGESGMKLIAFIDDDRNKIGKKIEGIDILSPNQAEMLFADGRVDQMILSIQNLDKEQRRSMVDMALQHGVRPLDVPPVDRWINGSLSFGQIRELNIEDLLGREPIQMNSKPIHENMNGKRIVVTGAAGSIGSELVRQLLTYQPEILLAIDQAETPMHDLLLELRQLGVESLVDLQIGDVRDAQQIKDTLVEFKPDVVFHAAAYKHVPMMEKQPWQAFDTNAMGSRNVLKAAEAAECPRFVFISTDKAVNPTSVMGATKRLAELLVL